MVVIVKNINEFGPKMSSLQVSIMVKKILVIMVNISLRKMEEEKDGDDFLNSISKIVQSVSPFLQTTLMFVLPLFQDSLIFKQLG